MRRSYLLDKLQIEEETTRRQRWQGGRRCPKTREKEDAISDRGGDSQSRCFYCWSAAACDSTRCYRRTEEEIGREERALRERRRKGWRSYKKANAGAEAIAAVLAVELEGCRH
ncbi:hypothetical protein PIB30_055475 [Stylosanthes scabra]|uniref:Uncharacterized protein n=1 Tax=Stylosanthes scabra TaxID=79078 RepID=A0ABU6RJ74_9FABA|nr:hypothetical protein [Stylosanthes scabra]